MDLNLARKILRNCYEGGYLFGHSIYSDSEDPHSIQVRVKLTKGKCLNYTASEIKQALAAIAENSIDKDDISSYRDDLSIKLNLFMESGFEEMGIAIRSKPLNAALARLGYYFSKEDKAEVTNDGRIIIKNLTSDEIKAFFKTFMELGVEEKFVTVTKDVDLVARLNMKSILNLFAVNYPKTTSEVSLFRNLRNALDQSGVFLTLPDNYNYRRTEFDNDVSFYKNMGIILGFNEGNRVYLKDGLLTMEWLPSIHHRTPESHLQKIEEIKSVLSYFTGHSEDPEIYTVNSTMRLPKDKSIPLFEYRLTIPFNETARNKLGGFISVSQLESNVPLPSTGIHNVKVEKWLGLQSDLGRSAA